MLAALVRNANVVRVDVAVSGGAQTLQAAPWAHVSEVRTRGFTGKDVKTAEIDSGAQLDHPDLADSIVGQQCCCSSATPGIGCCPSGAPTQSGASRDEDGEGHGTNVTDIISGAEINRALTSSRTRVNDPESGLSFPRLDCDQALVHIDRIFARGLDSGI